MSVGNPLCKRLIIIRVVCYSNTIFFAVSIDTLVNNIGESLRRVAIQTDDDDDDRAAIELKTPQKNPFESQYIMPIMYHEYAIMAAGTSVVIAEGW